MIRSQQARRRSSIAIALSIATALKHSDAPSDAVAQPDRSSPDTDLGGADLVIRVDLPDPTGSDGRAYQGVSCA
jgi:hypothetical protein